MYALGIPNRQYRRTTQVLGHESSEPITYNVTQKEDGFYLFSFPGADEYEFSEIVKLLKLNGINLKNSFPEIKINLQLMI